MWFSETGWREVLQLPRILVEVSNAAKTVFQPATYYH